MSELYLLTTVTDRRQLSRFISLYQEKNIATHFITLGYGTYSGQSASYFFGRTEKAVFFSLVSHATWRAVKRELERTIHIDVPGTGVAFIVPMSSIGGPRELAFFTDGQNDFQRGEESVMQGTDRELLVVISNSGYNEMVMDAARAAGAYGGTVFHARGTGMQRAEKFLGISLASEKDVTYIVVKTTQRDRIMQSVMLKAGLKTPAQSIVFSLPVTDTAGLRLIETRDDEEEDASADDAPAP